MEAAAIAHLRIAAGNIGMDAVIRLHEGEGRDDDAPDALDRVERQDAFVALDEPAHHVGLAAGPEGAAAAGARLDGDEPVDDLAALHQHFVQASVDPVDLVAQIGQSFRSGASFKHHGIASLRTSLSALSGRMKSSGRLDITSFQNLGACSGPKRRDFSATRS